jgi:GDPmannose 4,6-dehydratase
MTRALITGILGQDGATLARYLLELGYEVHGLVRRSSTTNTWRIDPIKNRLHLHEGDMLDAGSLSQIVSDVLPDEVYSLAAQSFVPHSFSAPVYTGDVTGLGALRMLEAIRQAKRPIRFYQAGTSEMFGSSPPPQNESTVFHPRSPYGVAKLFAHWATVNYREAYGLFVVNGILFNHEGPMRGDSFVTKKIAKAAAAIKNGSRDKLRLGNLDAKRDWGAAADYVRAMHLMLQQPVPTDYVIATGETHTVREFVELAFTHVGLDYEAWVEVDPAFYRPAEVHALCGDASKARRELGWTPKVSFRELVTSMVDAELGH